MDPRIVRPEYKWNGQQPDLDATRTLMGPGLDHPRLDPSDKKNMQVALLLNKYVGMAFYKSINAQY